MTHRHVLVVDTDLGHASRLQGELLRRGAEVSLATSAPQALQILTGGEIGGVVMDIPGIGGEDALLSHCIATGVPVVLGSDLFKGATNRALTQASWGVALHAKPMELAVMLEGLGFPAPTGPAHVLPEGLDAQAIGSSGSLGTLRFEAVLSAVARQQEPLRLRVAVNGVTRQVRLNGGRIHAVESDAADESMDALLQGDGLLQEAEVERLRRQRSYGVVESESGYVTAGIMRPEDLPALRSFVARRRLAPLFRAGQGAWELRRDDITTEEGVNLAIRDVILEAATHLIPGDLLEGSLGAFEAQPLIWLSGPPSRQSMRLVRWQRALLGSIDGETPTRELIEAAPTAAGARALVYALLAAGDIAFTG